MNEIQYIKMVLRLEHTRLAQTQQMNQAATPEQSVELQKAKINEMVSTINQLSDRLRKLETTLQQQQPPQPQITPGEQMAVPGNPGVSASYATDGSGITVQPGT